MAYHDWHVGMKVVCIDDEWQGYGLQVAAGQKCPLVKGQVYEIASIGPAVGIYHGAFSGTSVELVGVQKPGALDGHWFNAGRFRPVQSRKTDISIFTAMLNPQKQGADA